ncbi:MAG: hypothetical protein DMG40_10085 [Acidobacteria bacterium]|nr:MAG: hypothetical protein DMG40_10085 [Acidobacteriota bacterium]
MPAPSPGERTSACMNIFQATADFERWLPKRLPIVRQDMALKHQQMAEAAFSFFRATFYRWLQLWPNTCPELANAPSVLAVGDLHVENFGTWRDEEGRLIWGVNDLDEAWPCAYTLDLARLTTSAYLAISEEHLSLTRREAAEAVEEGYRDALAAGGKAFVLAEHHQWLRLLALSKLRDPVRFWEKVQQCPPYTAKPPGEARKLIEESLPEPCRAYQLKRRIAGLGSLGHPRILALSSWQGAFIAREAKGIRTSAYAWYKRLPSDAVYGAKLVENAIRVKDPCVHFHGHWLVRRLAPDCSRIELSSLPKERDEARLLYDMGWETANMHFASPQAIAHVKRDLASRRGRWLHKAAKAMYKATLTDWEDWRSSSKNAPKPKKNQN